MPMNRHLIGWARLDFWDTCVFRFYDPSGNKVMRYFPHERRKPFDLQTVTMRSYEDRLNTGLSK